MVTTSFSQETDLKQSTLLGGGSIEMNRYNNYHVGTAIKTASMDIGNNDTRNTSQETSLLLQQRSKASAFVVPANTATKNSSSGRLFSSAVEANCYYDEVDTVVSTPQSQHGSPWIRKPLSVVHHQQRQQENLFMSIRNQQSDVRNNDDNYLHTTNNTNQLHRHLSVWDLIGIGVGGTVGSGIFVLTGQIANQYSGPGTAISMFIAGISATCSGVCYAELSSRIPSPGSTYVYAYICWGELVAVVSASCLTLEYAISGAAVARTWGDKVIEWINSTLIEETAMTIQSWLLPFNGALNIPAFLVSATSTTLLLLGVSESKAVMNVVTTIKMIVVLIMIIGGLCLYNSNNMPPVVPLAPFGIAGILRGSTTSFFGFLGYDEVCCVAGEAKNPVRDMPRAVFGTLITVTICYVLASIALTGMIPYTDISPTSGFPAAFNARNVPVLGHITAMGEVLTLPVVVVISLLAQPRLLYSMAQDGLIPPIFSKIDPTTGNLFTGTAISGICMTIIATFVPFTYLDDLISAGILTAFSITNSCLILLRCQKRSNNNNNCCTSSLLSTRTFGTRLRRIMDHSYLEILLVCYNSLCFGTAMLWTHDLFVNVHAQRFLAVSCSIVTIWCLIHMIRTCPNTIHFGGTILQQDEMDLQQQQHIPSQSTSTVSTASSSGQTENCTTKTTPTTNNVGIADYQYFRTPAVPLLPCIGTAVNWYLIAQLDMTGLLLLCLYLVVTIVLYGIACAPYSAGHLHNWTHMNNNNHHYHNVTTRPTTTTSTGAFYEIAPSTNNSNIKNNIMMDRLTTGSDNQKDCQNVSKNHLDDDDDDNDRDDNAHNGKSKSVLPRTLSL